MRDVTTTKAKEDDNDDSGESNHTKVDINDNNNKGGFPNSKRKAIESSSNNKDGKRKKKKKDKSEIDSQDDDDDNDDNDDNDETDEEELEPQDTELLINPINSGSSSESSDSKNKMRKHRRIRKRSKYPRSFNRDQNADEKNILALQRTLYQTLIDIRKSNMTPKEKMRYFAYHKSRAANSFHIAVNGIYNYGGGSNSSNGHMVNSMNQESSIETNTRLPIERMDNMNGVSTPPSHRSSHTMNDVNGIYGQHASNGLPNDVNYNYDCNNNNGGRPRKPPSKSSLHSHSQSHHHRMTNSSGSGGGGASKHYRHENDGYRFYRGDGDGNRNGNRNVGGVGRQVRRRARIQSDTRYNGSKKKRGSKRERRRFEHDLESEGNREFEFQNDRDKSQIVRRRQQHSSKNNCDLSNKYGKLNEMIQGGNENGYQGNQQRSNRSLSRSSTNLTTTTSILTRKTRNGQTNSDYYKKKRTRNLTGVVDESRRDNDAINSSNMNNGYGLNEYIGDTSRFKRKHKENLNLKHSNNRNKSKHDFIAEKEKQKEKQKIKQKSRQMGNISVKRKKNVYDNYQSNSVDVPRDSDDDHDDDDNNNNESDRSDRSDKSDEYDEYDENEQDDDVLGDDMDTESVPSSAHNNNNNNSNNSHNKRRIQMEGEHRSGNSRKVDDVDPYDHENNFGGYVLLNNKNLQLNDMNEMELFDDNKNSRDLDTSFDMESNIYDNGNMNNSNVTDHENYNYEILAAKKNISQMNKQMKNLSNMTGKDAKYLIKKNQFNDE